LETIAKLLILLRRNSALFSKCALESLTNQTDFDSAIRRFVHNLREWLVGVFCFIEILSSPKIKNISLYQNSDLRYISRRPVPLRRGVRAIATKRWARDAMAVEASGG
jgi:hypothetical protein